MKKIIFFFVVMMLLFHGYSHCSTIILGDGKTVEAEIVEKADEYIKVNFQGVKLKYYLDQILSIDGKLLKAASLEPVDKKEPVSSLDKQIFSNGEWGYSFEYPSDWEILPKDEQKKGMAIGLRPKGDKFVALHFQVGNIPEDKIKGKTSLADLTVDFKAPEGLIKLSSDQITVGEKQAYFLRYSSKKPYKLPKVQNADIDLTGIVTQYFDYYHFSPIFSSQGKDRRYFFIELQYIKNETFLEEDNAGAAKEAIQKYNLMEKEFNKKIEERCAQALTIIDSFKLTPLKSEAPYGVLSSPKDGEAMGAAALGEPQTAKLHMESGASFFEKKQFEEAILEFKKAIEAEPGLIEAYCSLGHSYAAVAKYNEAIEHFKTALRISPHYADAFAGLGHVYGAMNNKDEAILNYKKAMEFNSTNAEAYSELGFIYNSLAQFDDSVDCFKKALLINPRLDSAHYGLGYVYVILGKYKNARDHLQKAKALLQEKDSSQSTREIDELLTKIPQ